jgi:branched-chain amino acid transport system ATP-binding protein
VLPVEQNSRMVLGISQRTCALTTRAVALSGNSADLLDDDRFKQLYLGGEP